MRDLCFRKNLSSRSRSLSAVAVVALSRRWRIADLDHWRRHARQLVIPVGRDRMVGNVAEMFARMKKIDRLFVRLKPFKKCPVIGCGVGDEPKVGSHFPNVGDLFRDLCFQCYLASFRPKYNVSKRLPSASWKLTVPQDAQHASSRPLERSATPSSETAKENRLRRYRLRLCVQGHLALLLPEIARRNQKTPQVARRRVHAPQFFEEF